VFKDEADRTRFLRSLNRSGEALDDLRQTQWLGAREHQISQDMTRP
jgi:hypothetical protein